MMKKKFYFLIILAFCSVSHSQQAVAYHLAVGMEFLDSAAYQKKYGVTFGGYATSGVSKDLERMQRIALRNGHVFDTICNKNATAENIKKKISEIGKKIKPGDTFIFYFSGHGVEIPDQNGDEKSGFDQAFAAYDDYLVDDEIYLLLNRYFKKTNNVMIVDACHSSTSYKMNKSFLDFKIVKGKMLKFQNESLADKQDENLNPLTCAFGKTEDITENFDLIYIGAAADNQEGDGKSTGGMLTIHLESIISQSAGIWNTYTFPRLACELRRRVGMLQTVQYHEIGATVNKYADKIPFKIL